MMMLFIIILGILYYAHAFGKHGIALIIDILYYGCMSGKHDIDVKIE
jgi:hypothetical protein